MSIEVENNSEHGAKFKMTQVDVEVTHAVVASIDTAELTKVPSPDLHRLEVSSSLLSFQCYLLHAIFLTFLVHPVLMAHSSH
jgi:hypothetical protein